MICRNCGKENIEKANFCSSCGSQLVLENANKKKKLDLKKYKVPNFKDLQVSAKVGYFSRFFALGYSVFIGVSALGFILYCLGSLFTSSDSDSAGFGLLGLMIVGPIFLGLTSLYCTIVSLFGIGLPTKWIDKKEKVSEEIEVIRIIGLIIGYVILISIPILAYLKLKGII